MKLATWNVNGIRAAAQKGFFDWLNAESPDVLCLQETKAHPSQLDSALLAPPGYTTHWSSAQKKGYSGVALYLKNPPLRVVEGTGVEKFDQEGRTLIVEYPNFVLFNGYYPNGQHTLVRVGFKLEYSDRALELAKKWQQETGKPVILTGDFNTAHKEIDLARPKENEGNTGFLPEERAWIDKLVGSGFIDIFRAFEPGPHHYSWWSYRAGARPRNVGWRIDYFFITPDLKDRVKSVRHQPQVMGSDHCPIVMELF